MQKIIRLPSVKALTGLSRSTIYAMTAAGTFPARVKLGARAVGWVREEVEAWMQSRIDNNRVHGSGAANVR
jgi:prophage regulatory protein